MVNHEAYPLESVTLMLRKGDYARLRKMHGMAAKVIRKLVIDYLAAYDRSQDPDTNVDLEGL